MSDPSAQGPTNPASALSLVIGVAPDLTQNPGAAVNVATAGGDVAGNAQAVAHAQNQVTLNQATNEVAPKVGGHKGLFSRLVNDVVNVSSMVENAPGELVGLGLDAAGLPGGGVARNSNPVVAGTRALAGVAESLVANPSAGAAVSAVGSLAGPVGLIANMPLANAQHEYRYLKDVGEQHGVMAVLPAALAMAAGAIGGGQIAGSQGAVLGAEAGGYAAGHIFYPDSWDRTGAANYVDVHTGLPVSVGRDLATQFRRDIGAPLGITGPGPAKPGSRDWLSGAIDGIADLAADPVAKGLKFRADTLTAEGAGGWLGDRIGGIGLDNIDQAAQRPAVADAFKAIANTTKPSQVRQMFPLLSGISDRLARAETPEAVAQVFKDTVAVRDLMTSTLPTQTITQGVLRNARTFVASKVGDAVPWPSLQPIAMDTTDGAAMTEWSNKVFNHADNSGAQGLWREMRYSLKRSVADDLYDQYINIPSTEIGERKLMASNIHLQVALAGGATPQGDFVTNLRREVEGAVGGVTNEGHVGSYGYDDTGADLSPIQRLNSPGTTRAAISEGQTSTMGAFMNYHDLRMAARSTDALAQLFGGLDDFIYQHWTSTVFKPMALASAGFGIRVALAEAIPNSLRLGPVEMVRSRIASTLAKAGYDLGEQDTPHIAAAVANMFRKIPIGQRTEDLFNHAVDLVGTEGGHIIVPGVQPGHAFSTDPSPHEGFVDRLNKSLLSKPKVVEGDEFGSFGPGQGSSAKSHEELWQSQFALKAADPGDQVAARAYARALDAGLGRDEAVTQAAAHVEDWMNTTASDAYKAKFMRNTAPAVPGQDPVASWAEAKVKAVRGLVNTPRLQTTVPVVDPDTLAYSEQPGWIGGVTNRDLLGHIAAGTSPPLDALAAIPIDERPTFIPGRMTIPVPGSANLINKAASAGIRKLAEPIINYLSREPTFLLEYAKQMDTLAPFIEDGLMTHLDAMPIAKIRAVAEMTPFIHNTLERSMFAEIARNVMPFYFAQEQAYKRVGRLLATDPGAFRQYQMILAGMSNIGQPAADGSGGQFLTIPGTGWLGREMPWLLSRLGISTTLGASVGFSGNMRSLASVFPFTEDPNPLAKMGTVAVIPMKTIAGLFPQTEPAFSAIMGTTAAQSSMWSEIIPNTAVRTAMTALNPWMQAHAQASTTLQLLQEYGYRQTQAMNAWVKAGHAETDPGHPQIIPDSVRLTNYATDPHPWDQWLDTVRAQVRYTTLLKAALGVFSPLSPVTSVGDLNIKGELHALTTKFGLNDGLYRFRIAHPDATAYTIGLSSGPSGQNVPATQGFMDFHAANGHLFDTYPAASYWVAPQDPGKFDPALYTEQLRMDIRHLKPAQTFLADLFVAEGNKVFYDQALPGYEQQRAQTLGMADQYTAALAEQKAGRPQAMALFRAQETLAARGASVALKPLTAGFNQWVADFGKTHLTWYANYLDATGAGKVRMQQTIDEMRKMYADGAAPQTPEAVGVKVLLSSLDAHLAEINPNQFANGVVPSLVKEQANVAWQQYLLDTSAAHPELSNVIARVFRSYQG